MRKLLSFSVCAFLLASAAAETADARRRAGRTTKKERTTESLMKQADSLILVGSYEQAAAAYRRVLGVAPKHVAATARLAHALWRLGQADQALKVLEGLSAASRPPVMALQVLSDIHLQQKNYLKAAGVLEKLVARRRGDLALKMQLADCYREMSRLNNPEARARALKLYSAVEHAAGKTNPVLGRRAMEAGLTMRHGELGEAQTVTGTMRQTS